MQDTQVPSWATLPMRTRRITLGREIYISTFGDVMSDMVGSPTMLDRQALKADSHARPSSSLRSRTSAVQHPGGYERYVCPVPFITMDWSAIFVLTSVGKTSTAARNAL